MEKHKDAVVCGKQSNAGSGSNALHKSGSVAMNNITIARGERIREIQAAVLAILP